MSEPMSFGEAVVAAATLHAERNLMAELEQLDALPTTMTIVYVLTLYVPDEDGTVAGTYRTMSDAQAAASDVWAWEQVDNGTEWLEWIGVDRGYVGIASITACELR